MIGCANRRPGAAILLAIATVVATGCLGVCSGHDGHDHDALVAPIFKQHGVVTDVLDVAPQHELIATYANGVSVQFGDELTPTQVKEQPTVSWTADASKYYTLIFSDPDAPSRAEPTAREWLHWLVVNIPGNNVTAGETVAEYVGSGPPQGTGLHRYVFTVFQQEHKHTFGEPFLARTNRHRNNFNTRAFAEKHALGEAVAGNLYQAQYDEYVPTLHAQFV